MAGARLLIALLPAVLPADFPRMSDITLDWRVALASTAATLAAIAVCGLVPALQARRLDLVQSLADDNLAPVGGVRTPAGRLRAAIMAGQIAVACVLLIGAGLLGRSLQSLRQYRSRIRSRQSAHRTAAAATRFHLREERRDAAGHRRSVAGAPRRAARLVRQRAAARLRRRAVGFNLRLPRDPATMSKVQTLHRTVDPRVPHGDGVATSAPAAFWPTATPARRNRSSW